MIFKILLIAFALFALSKTLKQYKDRRVSKHWFTVWSLFWVVVIVVAFLPHTTDLLAQYVGVEKGADLIVYCAVVILSYGLYRVIAKQEKFNRELTELVRQMAIEQAKKPDKEVDKSLSR